MVRLESREPETSHKANSKFTFQYGQIRKITLVDFEAIDKSYLHSSMVRLERVFYGGCKEITSIFTFQYGQIRKEAFILLMVAENEIYIPVWLDQKVNYIYLTVLYSPNLHSSMVRLESIALIASALTV